MSLVVEDGTGMASAEAYCSVAAADARATAFGNATWTGTTAVKEAALRAATRYMGQAYRNRWAGYRRLHAQALDWPRYGVEVDAFPVAYDAIPADIVNACADLAVKALAGDLAPDLERRVVREKVGPLETEYDRYAPAVTTYRATDMALAPYLQGSAAMAVLVRT
jgi:hypothetical protein